VNATDIQNTSDRKLLLLPRLLAGGPLVLFSLMHFMNPEHFRNILTASGLPFVELSVYAASTTELVAGLLLLSGLFARVGGMLGIATMLPAIYSTIVLMRMTPADLPAGQTEVPFVPPIPLPIAVLVASALVVVFGGGKLSLDWKMTRQPRAEAS